MITIPFTIEDIKDFVEHNRYRSIVKLNNINVIITSNTEAEQIEFTTRDNRGDETVCVVHMNEDINTLVDELHVMLMNHLVSERYTKVDMVNDLMFVLA